MAVDPRTGESIIRRYLEQWSAEISPNILTYCGAVDASYGVSQAVALIHDRAVWDRYRARARCTPDYVSWECRNSIAVAEIDYRRSQRPPRRGRK